MNAYFICHRFFKLPADPAKTKDMEKKIEIKHLIYFPFENEIFWGWIDLTSVIAFLTHSGASAF